MAGKPLRSQLNQIRAWVRQGRTDAWIAHQLEVSTAELREFRRRHDLTAEGEAEEADLRDEIEAEVEAATLAAEEEEAALDEDGGPPGEPADEEEGGAEEKAGEGADERPGRRKRRRRGRRRASRAGGLEATFDHGETDGFGLWLDPAVQDDPVYSEHWAGHRAVEVTIEPDRITIKRS